MTVREILNNLIQDCQDMDKDLNFVNLTIDQALSSIREAIEKELAIPEHMIGKPDTRTATEVVDKTKGLFKPPSSPYKER